MSSHSQIQDTDGAEIEAPEELRPRIYRKLGLPLLWDQAVDGLSPPSTHRMSGWWAILCRSYRAIRPKYLGDRCAFEPSCSRYSEMCFRAFGVRKGIALTVKRLRRCNGSNGGLDLPPMIERDHVSKLEETISEIQD